MPVLNSWSDIRKEILWVWKEHEVTYLEDSAIPSKEVFWQMSAGGRSKNWSVES